MPWGVSNPPFQTELHRRGLRVYSFEGIPAAGVLSAGAARTLVVPVITLDSGVSAGAPKGAEAVENNLAQTFDYPGATTFWDHPMYASVLVKLMGFVAPDSNSAAGLVIGSESLATPSGAPGTGLIQLYARGDTLTWELLTARGNATAYTLTTLSGVTAPTGAGDHHRLSIYYQPGTVYAYVDGVLGAQVSGGSVPNVGSNRQHGAGIISRCGSTAGDRTQASFNMLTVETMGAP